MSIMDWGTLISTVVTGVVGIAGIGGSIVSARLASKSAAENLNRNIRAEDTRIKRADKRAVYVNCLAELSRLDNLLKKQTLADDAQTFRDAETAAWVAVQEITIIGPSAVVDWANSAYALRNTRNDFDEAYEKLVDAMRDDLSETAIEPSDL